ncbi:MAG: beta-ketoacyl synthase [Planctomycetes bacterium]|nr:beta-ketoacyl synthase [Planctomycetota bacterium]
MNPTVVGRGAVSCFGRGAARLVDAVFAGEQGLRPRARLAKVECLTSVAGEVPREVVDAAGDPTRLPLAMAADAARQAITEWGSAPDRHTLLVLATTKADLSGIAPHGGAGFGSPHRLATALATELRFPGPTAAVSCACASGLAALAFAGRALRAGRFTRALVVGVDALHEFVVRGFSALLALAPGPCRPFDRARDGLSLGEGAGAVLLSAVDGEAGAELLGWGESNDANHITGPSRDGTGLALSITRALRSADVPPDAVDAVHLHGTGTPFNDAMEGRALARVFAVPVPAAGSKAQLGHTLGAAGLLESLIALGIVERTGLPPNLGLQELDAECPPTLQAAATPLPRAERVLKVAAGFGGINAAVLWGARR